LAPAAAAGTPSPTSLPALAAEYNALATGANAAQAAGNTAEAERLREEAAEVAARIAAAEALGSQSAVPQPERDVTNRVEIAWMPSGPTTHR
jgi:hypothetical protein